MKRIVIVGGGVIGLFTAYYLSEEGFEVTILDGGNLRDNCSIGNAGMIVPSHIVPLASPGIIHKGIRWLFSQRSPFYIHPKFDRRLWEWCWLFFRSANRGHVERSIPYLKDLSLYSRSLYMHLASDHPGADLGMHEKGLLMLFKTAAARREEEGFALLARAHGLEADILSPADVSKLEPHAEVDVLGGIFFPGDAHLNPVKLHEFLTAHLESKGVRIERHSEVYDFVTSGGRVVRALSSKGEHAGDCFIICAGSRSGEIAAKMKINMPMLGGKGYSFMVENIPAIQRPAILTEKRVAVTPFDGQVRFGGTMEITDDAHNVNMNRVKGIHEAIASYYSAVRPPFPDKGQVWSGMRPCSPDGLPYIGFAQRWDNLLFGTGHSMMGVSLAPATGKILSDLVLNRELRTAVNVFSPDRYSGG